MNCYVSIENTPNKTRKLSKNDKFVTNKIIIFILLYKVVLFFFKLRLNF